MSSTGSSLGTRPFGPTNADRAAELDDALVDAVLKAVEVTGAHAGSVFLASADGGTLVLAAAAGMPPSLLSGWRRIAVNSPIPVAEAYRLGRMVHLADTDTTVRRFPQLAVAVPYPFGSASVPVEVGRETLGVLAVVWAAEPGGQGLSKAKRRHLRTTAGRLGMALAQLQAHGAQAGCDAPAAAVEVPIPAVSAVREEESQFDEPLDREFHRSPESRAEDPRHRTGPSRGRMGASRASSRSQTRVSPFTRRRATWIELLRSLWVLWCTAPTSNRPGCVK